MEQINVKEGASNSFSEDVKGVYDQIAQYRRKSNDTDESDQYWLKSKLGIVSTVFLLIIFGTLASLYFLPPTVWGNSDAEIRLVLQFIVLAAYAIGGGIVLAHFVSFKKQFKDFTGQMIDIMSDTAKDETALFNSLDGYSTSSIQYVANRFDQTSSQVGQLRSFLLGTIEKVGIIPGLIATVLAISKVAESTGVSWIELLSAVLAGFYLGMFPLAKASIKLKRISMLLNQYLTLVRLKDEHLGNKNQPENQVLV